VGPGDLACSLGYPGAGLEEPEVAAVFNETVSKVKDAGKYITNYSITPEGIDKLIKNGYDIVNLGMDITIIGNAVNNLCVSIDRSVT
jgi:2-keto-3-deoxy-L-rhamnonate aldolase RhmA